METKKRGPGRLKKGEENPTTESALNPIECNKPNTKPEMTKLGRPTEYPTVEILQNAINDYFATCKSEPLTIEVDGRHIIATDTRGKPIIMQNPPTMAGLAYDLGFATRQSIYDLEQRGDDFSYVIKRARLFVEAHHEANLSTRDKPVGDIFWLKNHDWDDKTKIEHSGSVTIIDDIPKDAAD
jgi:hypothetical protein